MYVIVFYDVGCYFVRCPSICVVVFVMNFMTSWVGRGHFVFCVGVDLCFGVGAWV